MGAPFREVARRGSNPDASAGSAWIRADRGTRTANSFVTRVRLRDSNLAAAGDSILRGVERRLQWRGKHLHAWVGENVVVCAADAGDRNSPLAIAFQSRSGCRQAANAAVRARSNTIGPLYSRGR
jgi:hypothetical protein